MNLSATELARELKNGKFSPAYYFFGDDDYRMNEAIRFLAQSYLPKDFLSSNVSRVDLGGAKFDDLRIELAQPPFFGERKVLVIYDPQKLSSKQSETMLKYLTPGQPDQVVILYTRAARKPKKTSAFVKRMNVVMPVVEFNFLQKREAVRRAAQKLGEHGMTIEAQAADELFEMTGGDYGKLSGEIEKLISYNGSKESGSEVTVEIVREVCAQGARRSVYQLVDAVVAGDTASSLAILEKLLISGESPTGILFWLGSQYINLYLVKGDRRLPSYQSWLEPRLKSQARNLSLERIEFALAVIADCEAFMKGGASSLKTASPRDALTEIVLHLANPSAVTGQSAARRVVGL